jgi:hypothetical protein
VEDEVFNRFAPLVEIQARRCCRQLFHRGAACRGHGAGDGECAGVYGTAFSEIMRQVIGSTVSRSMLVDWATRRRKVDQAFDHFLHAHLHADDVLRASCSERGLRNRGDRPPAGLVEDLTDFYGELGAEGGSGAWPAALHPEQPKVIRRWIEGLWRDAVQTGDGELIDATRLARWMLDAEPTAEDVDLVRELAHRLDDHIAGAQPEWYDTYLDRGRQQTNPTAELV